MYPKIAAIIKILLLANLIIIWITTLSPGDGTAFGYWDKVFHFLMYFSLSIPIVFLQPKGWKLFINLFLCILMGILIEFIQVYIPGRNLELYDMFANSLGTILGAFVTFLFLSKKLLP